MKKDINRFLSEDLLHEYLLLLSPDESVCGKIKQEKEIFAEKLECPSCLHIKPHITLINFVQYKTMEKRFMLRMEQFAIGIKPFSISLYNFGSFPSHTIFINIQTKNNIVQMVKDMRDLKFPIKIDKERHPHYIMEPHITLARRLEPWQYEKGWLEWSRRDFNAAFTVNNMILLRRKTSSSPCIKLAEFKFKGIKEKTIQATLF
ncbi:MAG: 2'-5' RNA ligase family protein [Arachidicoccus sp.]|nr:2'-5' RNA ligase family protein [Arachidicoccus sp.]